MATRPKPYARKTILIEWMLLGASLVPILFLISNFISNNSKAKKERALIAIRTDSLIINQQEKLNEAQSKLVALQAEYSRKISSLISNQADSKEGYSSKVINTRLDKQDQMLSDLKQSINPAHPEEVLTIARMNDRMEYFEKQLNSVEKNTEIRQQIFEDSINRESSSSGQLWKIVLLSLIPFILNISYTMWKDHKKPKELSEESLL